MEDPARSGELHNRNTSQPLQTSDPSSSDTAAAAALAAVASTMATSVVTTTPAASATTTDTLVVTSQQLPPPSSVLAAPSISLPLPGSTPYRLNSTQSLYYNQPHRYARVPSRTVQPLPPGTEPRSNPQPTSSSPILRSLISQTTEGPSAIMTSSHLNPSFPQGFGNPNFYNNGHQYHVNPNPNTEPPINQNSNLNPSPNPSYFNQDHDQLLQ